MTSGLGALIRRWLCYRQSLVKSWLSGGLLPEVRRRHHNCPACPLSLQPLEGQERLDTGAPFMNRRPVPLEGGAIWAQAGSTFPVRGPWQVLAVILIPLGGGRVRGGGGPGA